ncbi:MAG TPA: redoxin domain-containing protein [Planctomycetota bacterium]|nr:redoxin domain-containing protein [Planctomycetota bacterium]
MHPRPGDPAPDFTLANPYDVLVTLESVLASGAALIEFIRGTWDPNARSRIEELLRARSDLAELGARAILITCERPHSARLFIERGSEPVTLLVDTARETAKLFGVYQRFSYGALHVARPGSFVVDRAGYVRFAHVGRSPIDVAPARTLLDALAKLREEERRMDATTASSRERMHRGGHREER